MGLCFNIKCLKMGIIGSALIIGLLGILFAVFCKQMYDSKIAEANETQSTFLAIGIVGAIIMIFICCIGLYAGWSANRLFLFIYMLVIGLLFALFFITFWVLYKDEHAYKDQIKEACDNNEKADAEWIEDLHDAYDPSMRAAFCSKACPCSAKKEEFIYGKHHQFYNYYHKMVIDLDGPQTITQCEGYGDAIPKVRKRIVALLSYLENEYSCSGLCKPEPFFMFSDVKHGVPKGSCRGKLESYIDDKYVTLQIITGICWIICLLVFLSALCLCCHPERKDEGYKHVEGNQDPNAVRHMQ